MNSQSALALARVERGARLVEQQHLGLAPSRPIAMFTRWRLPPESVRHLVVRRGRAGR